MLKFLLAFLISTASFAAQPGGIPSVTVSAPGANTGSVSISPSMLSGTGVNGIFSIYGAVASASGGNFYALYKGGTGAQYQVTSGKTAYCFDVTASCSAAGCFIQAVSNGASFNNASTISSTPAYQGGASAAYVWPIGATANVQQVLPGTYQFAASTYAGYQTQNATQQFTVHMDCFEQ